MIFVYLKILKSEKMTIVIKQNSTREEIKNSIEKMSRKKKNGIKKYFGISKTKTKTDAVAFQKKVRNEWD